MDTKIISPFAVSALHNWLRELKSSKGISDHTERAYLEDLTGFFTFLQGYQGQQISHQSLAELTPRAIRGYLANCQARLLSETSRARKLSAIKSFLKDYYNKKDIKNDVVLSIRGPSKPERLPRPLTANAAKDAIAITSEVDKRPWVQMRDRALLTLLYACGLRISEALNLTKSQTPLGRELRILGKGKKVRIVPVLDVAREAIDRYLSLLPYHLESNDQIFRGVRGGAMSSRQAAHLMEQVRNLLGLPASTTPHALRHSFASHLLAEGGDIRAIQELLGHQSLSATQIYTKLDASKLLDVYKDAHPKGRD